MSGIADFFKRARGLSLVERWNFHYRITKENVAEHSFWVAFYAMSLLDLDDVDSVSHLRTVVLERALSHDLEEAVSGDCPALVKRRIKGPWSVIANSALLEAVGPAPREIRQRMINRTAEGGLLEVTHIADKYVKAADLIDVIEYANFEMAHGSGAYHKIRAEAITLLSRFKDLPSVSRVLLSYGFDPTHPPVNLPEEMTHL